MSLEEKLREILLDNLLEGGGISGANTITQIIQAFRDEEWAPIIPLTVDENVQHILNKSGITLKTGQEFYDRFEENYKKIGLFTTTHEVLEAAKKAAGL